MKPRRLFLLVIALAAALVLARLGEPDWTPPRPVQGFAKRYVWDECLYGFTAHRLLADDPAVWVPNQTYDDMRTFDTSDLGPHVGYAVWHPPLAVFSMTASSAALGWSPFAVRLPGALCGVVLVACTWLLVRRLRDEGAATLAAALVALDGVWFTISRVAIPHAYVAAATAAALVAGLVAWQDAERRGRFTLAAGAFCGLALAFKTSALTITLLLAAALLVRTWTRIPGGTRKRALLTWAIAFVVLPPLLYLASWIPFFAVWHKSWDDFADVHASMRAWHASMPKTMGPSTPWWTWPVIWKPVLLFEESVGDGWMRRIVCRGNPFLWWAAAAAVPLAAMRLVRGRTAGDLWIVGGYLAAWVVFAFVPRFGFSYYMLPAAPLAAAAVALAFHDAFPGGRARTVAFCVYGTLAAGTFVWMMPSLAAVAVAR